MRSRRPRRSRQQPTQEQLASATATLKRFVEKHPGTIATLAVAGILQEGDPGMICEGAEAFGEGGERPPRAEPEQRL